MYNFMDSYTEVIVIFFFVVLVIFGSFFALNLVLASIIEAFDKVNSNIETSISIDDLNDIYD
jgi:hypothetical protein